MVWKNQRRPWKQLIGKQTLVELSQRYQAHPNQITKWEKRLLESENFSADAKTEPDVKGLHAKISQLAIENDFSSNGLGRIDVPSAKK